MRRFTIPLLVVAVLLLSVVTVSVRPNVVAQEATLAAMRPADHPVVGAWRWNNAPGDPIPYSYAIFQDAGIYHEVAGGDTGIRVWQATGQRTAEIGYLFQDIDDIDPFSAAFERGTVMIRATVEVNSAGDAVTATYSVEARGPDGTVAFQADRLEGTLTRITLESLVFPETPGAATPTS
jgi:hypothetical protein